jgi:acyl-coenzyme A thioesterase PaaI-like protein
VRKGRSLHVWAVEISSEDGELVAVARCTVAIRKMSPETAAGGGPPAANG